MARKFLTSIDLNLSELQNAVIQNLASDPTTGNTDGRIYYNTVADELRVYANGAWQAVGSGDINNVVGTDGEIEVSVVNGVATISLPATINADLNGNADTATNANYATSAGNADTADYATNAGNANYATSAGSADTATNADYATNAGNANYATNAGNADYALNAGNADYATNAGNASTADLANSVAANSVVLGSDTTGDYVASVSGTDGVSVTGTGESAAVTIANTDKGSDQSIFKSIYGGGTVVSADSNNDAFYISAGTGIGIQGDSGSKTFTFSNEGVVSLSGTPNEISVDSSTGSVTLSLPSDVTFPGTVTLNADPTQALQAATKQYVDAVAEGLHVHASVATATTANIADLGNPPASIDEVTLTDGMRVLVKDQSTQSENGIYVYVASTTELVRASDYDTAAEIDSGDFVFVSGGDTYAATGWVQENNVTTLGTDPIVWQQFSGAGEYVAGNGLQLIGNAFSIDTSVTVDVSTAQTLTNKTLTSPVVSGLYLSDNNIVIEGNDDTHETTLTFTNPTADRTITFKDETGTVAFTSDITSAIDALTTSDIEEGTNLYFTDERAQDAVGDILSGSNSIAVTYNDGTPSITFDTTLASTSYLSKSSGLAVDISALETKLVEDSFTKKVAANVGNGANTSFAILHNFNTRDVVVNVYDNSTYDTVEVDVVRTDADTVTVSFAVAPASNAYRVVVVG